MKLVAVAGWRYEPKWLVDEMVESLMEFCDDVAIVDDRNSAEFWSNEAKYRLRQRAALEAKGATHALVTSPDERFDVTAKSLLRPMVEAAGQRPIMFSFPLMELFEPLRFRTDGIWGRKKRTRCYPLLPGQQYTTKALQTSAVPRGSYTVKLMQHVHLYHLKMIEPENRWSRAAAYEAMDPGYKLIPRTSRNFASLDRDMGNRFEEQGYFYLADDSRMQLTNIPDGHGYRPDYSRPYIFSPDWSLLGLENPVLDKLRDRG